jgi:DNA-binding CsgD family transcriptional regulator/tetratricopeptide (TPR) repeat protein
MHARRSGHLLELRRLDNTQVREMVRACLGSEVSVETYDEIAEFADGVPFLVEELLAAWADTGNLLHSDDGWSLTPDVEPVVPGTFADTVCGRLRAIGDSARLILGAGAVFGPCFDWRLVVAATGLEEAAVLDTLRRAVSAHLCVAETLHQDAFKFRHALTRHAVLGELLPAERRSLAGRLLNALEEAHPDLSGDLAQSAVELAQTAGEAARAARLLLIAAAEAKSHGGLATAEALLQRARAVTAEGPTAAQIDQALTEVLAAAGKPLAALEVGERLFRPHSGLQPAQAPSLRLVLARAATLGGQWRQAEHHIAEARALPSARDPALRAEADLAEAHTLMAQKRTIEATNLARQALDAAKEAGLASIAGEALMIVGRAERLRDLASARAAFAEALEWAEKAGSAEARIGATFELATIPLLDGGPVEPLLEARTAALAAGVPVTAAYVDLMLAHRHEDDLELDLTRQAAQRAVDAARRYRLDPLLGSACTQLAFAHGALGDRRAMDEALLVASAAAGDDPDVAAGSCIARAMVALLAEDRPGALHHLDAAMEVLRASKATYPAPHRGLWALLHVIEDDGTGIHAVNEVRESPAMTHRAVRGLLACAEAVQLGRLGRRGEAEEAWATGDADLAYSPGRRHIARRLVSEAAIRDGWGDPVHWLPEAADFFDRKALPRVAAACRSLLRTTGARVGTRRQDHDGMPEELRIAGVTRRELEVLDLLAEGLSTSTIATRLYLSVKTVERHTANLATKLGLNGRAHVVAYAATRRGSLGTERRV